MLKVEAVGTIYYTCELSDEEENKVINYIRDNPEEFEFMNNKEAIVAAVDILYRDSEINLYDNAIESDYSTEEIKWSEFEERSAEEILRGKI